MNPSDEPRTDEELELLRDKLEQRISSMGEQLIEAARDSQSHGYITWKGLEGIEHNLEDFARKLQQAFAEAISPEFIAKLDALAKEVENKPPFDPQAEARRRARDDLAKKRRDLRKRKGKL